MVQEMINAVICAICGTRQTNPNAKFCGVCGTTYPVVIPVLCPNLNCRTPRTNPNAEFCGVCGTPYPKPGQADAGAAPKSSTKLSGHHDVFISYSSKDKPVADAVCASLENASVRCWIAPRDVLPGEDFPKAIMQGINESKVMVLIFSANANASPHVTREVTKAVSKGLIIIPFRIEDAPMSESMEYLIGLPHWLDAITSPLSQHIDTLVKRVKSLVEDHK
jgi:hypothetical protein